jgi:hypothetical protein
MADFEKPVSSREHTIRAQVLEPRSSQPIQYRLSKPAKSKLSLCLIETLFCEDVWGSGRITPNILNLDIG